MTVYQESIFEPAKEAFLDNVEEVLEAIEPASFEPDPITEIALEVESFVISRPVEIIVTTNDECENMNKLLQTVKRIATHAEDTRKELVSHLNAEVKRINGRFGEITTPLAAFEGAAKEAILGFRREEQRKAAEAQRKAEEERQRKEQELREAARKQAEQAEEERREAERKRLEAEAAQGRERAALLTSARADEARAQRLEEESRQNDFIATAVASVPASAMRPALPPKLAGSSVAKTWKTGINDKAAFVAWALKSGNLHYLDINIGMLDKQAAAAKGEQQWPGVSVELVETMRSSRR